MIFEKDPLTLMQWLPYAALGFLVIITAFSILGCLFGYVVASFRHGPTEAFYVVSRVFFQAIPDVIFTSPRRVWAIAKLAIRETTRRRVLIVAFAIFGLLILLGGWFLDTKSDNPERVYIGFLGWGTQLLVIMLGLLISSFSLPTDIKNKTIYTVTTKPVRATEIVFGRILGFTLIGTLLLSVIWLVGYFFIIRGLSHTHTLDPRDIRDIVGKTSSIDGGRVSANATQEAITSQNKYHRHQIEFFPPADESEEVHDDSDGHSHDSIAVMSREMGHSHAIQKIDGEYRVGEITEHLMARVPIYAQELRFRSREGDDIRRGYNPGMEWDYRSYIDGGATKAAAIFHFDNVYANRFDAGPLPLNAQMEVFRSHKGEIEDRVSASIHIASRRETNSQYLYETVRPVDVFEVEEYKIQTRFIPRKMRCRRTNLLADPPTVEVGEYDLFEDIAPNGKLDLLITCDNDRQYLGFAKKDVFFQPKNKSFFQNFLKAYLGIWLQMLVVVSLGVMFSTFLSSIVAMLATISALVLGLQAEFLKDLAFNRQEGGGPIESFYRLVTQQNMLNPLEDGAMSSIVTSVDLVIIFVMNSLAYVMPDYSQISFFNFLAEGYNIEWQQLLVGAIVTMTFCFVTTIIGYFCLKTREIAG
jgi:hypothetical protein